MLSSDSTECDGEFGVYGVPADSGQDGIARVLFVNDVDDLGNEVAQEDEDEIGRNVLLRVNADLLRDEMRMPRGVEDHIFTHINYFNTSK